MIKRIFDLVVSAIVLIIISPFLMVIALVILLVDGRPVFFLQERVGKDRRPFRIVKFRTMKPGSEAAGQITVGRKDSRVTVTGNWLRKYKFDELPQFLNVLSGDMSVVGPRPEVPEYVRLYDEEQLKVLTVRPGITDNASIEFADESELLGRSDDPEQEYIRKVMPAKLQINLEYIRHPNVITDLLIIFRTIIRVFRN